MSKVIAFSHKYAPGATVAFDCGTGTDTTQAVTIHKIRGQITSSTTNLAAKTTEDITLTNRFIKAKSMVICMVKGGGAGDVVVSRVAVSAGSVVITILNADPSNACNAAYVVDFLVIHDSSTIA